MFCVNGVDRHFYDWISATATNGSYSKTFHHSYMDPRRSFSNMTSFFFSFVTNFVFVIWFFPKAAKLNWKKMVVEASHIQRIIIMEKKLGPSNWLTASRHTHTHGEKKKRKKSGRVIKEQRWCAGGRLLMLLGQRVFDDTTRRRDQVNRTDCAAGGLVS